MLASNKIALVKIAQARLQLSDDNYRAVLEGAAGVTSARDLSDSGFASVMDRFRELGFVSDAHAAPRRRQKKVRHAASDPITDEQQWRIDQNYQEMGYDTIERRNGFNLRQCGVQWPQTVDHGRLVIQGQESILRRAGKH